MKERPILFNTEMVKAVLAGRKTQTRRVIKPQPLRQLINAPVDKGFFIHGQGGNSLTWLPTGSVQEEIQLRWKCPYGQVGDRLWVRETWRATVKLGKIICPAIKFKAGGGQLHLGSDLKPQLSKTDGKWKPSIHMPRWASRINLEITNIRVERVQDISEEDALAEGIERSEWEYSCEPYRNYEEPKMSPGKNKSLPSASFCTLWNSINEKRGYGWKVNPWVWVVEFKVIT